MKVVKIFLLTSILVSFTACTTQSDIDEAVATAVAEALATPTPTWLPTPVPLPTPTPTPTDLPVYEGSPARSGHKGGYGDDFGNIGWRLQAKVLRVIDGDTIEVEGVGKVGKQAIPKGTKVRYLDIDTPETVHPDKPVQCYGPEATLKNKQLVEGKTVTLRRHDNWEGINKNFDNYGRLLAYVYTDEYFVNGELVWSGFAYAYRGVTAGGGWENDNDKHGRRYVKEKIFQWEQDAKKNKRGMWGKCKTKY